MTNINPARARKGSGLELKNPSKKGDSGIQLLPKTLDYETVYQSPTIGNQLARVDPHIG